MEKFTNTIMLHVNNNKYTVQLDFATYDQLISGNKSMLISFYIFAYISK